MLQKSMKINKQSFKVLPKWDLGGSWRHLGWMLMPLGAHGQSFGEAERPRAPRHFLKPLEKSVLVCLGRILVCLGRVLGSSWTPFGPSGRHLEASWGAKGAPEGPKNDPRINEKRNKPFSTKLWKTNTRIIFHG